MKRVKIYGLFVFGALVLASCDKRPKNEIFPPAITDNLLAKAEKEGNLSVFVAAMKLTRMDSALQFLGQYTIFAPTDQAFQAAGLNASNLSSVPAEALRTILRYHILSGRVPALNLLPGPNASYAAISNELMYTSTYAGANAGSFMNGRRITKTDIIANNGIIHTVNGILLPPPGNIMQTLEASPNFSFLVAAIDRAGLRTALSASGATDVFNVFAPTNAAFQAAGFADVTAIQTADPAVLSNILRYHVIPRVTVNQPLPSPFFLRGRIFSVDLRNGWLLRTLQGTDITVSVSSGGAQVRGTNNPQGSNITLADIIARNGVVHQIDRVLLP